MPCIRFGGAIVCVSPNFRLPLEDGRRVFMEWHSYLGPTFFHDRARSCINETWYEDPLICKALDWFTGRGCRA
jgi:hypothetical protein